MYICPKLWESLATLVLLIIPTKLCQIPKSKLWGTWYFFVFFYFWRTLTTPQEFEIAAPSFWGTGDNGISSGSKTHGPWWFKITLSMSVPWRALGRLGMMPKDVPRQRTVMGNKPHMLETGPPKQGSPVELECHLNPDLFCRGNQRENWGLPDFWRFQQIIHHYSSSLLQNEAT